MQTQGDPFTRSPELEAVIRRWVTAYAAHDAASVTNLFSRSGALCYVGSSGGEIWHGERLRAGFAAYAAALPPFHVEHDHVEAYESGHAGWGYWTGLAVPANGGEPASFRGTFIFSLEDGVWRIVHMHNSNPVSNADTLGYDESLFDDLLSAAAQSGPALPATGMASVMFTDIADSTALAQAIGDAGWSRIVGDHLDRVGGIVTGHGGTLVKSLGDGTMSTFPSARGALEAARAIQAALEDDDSEPRLAARVGLHTGDIVEAKGDFFGTVVNKAARVAAIARPGEIRASDATRAIAGASAGFVFTDPVSVPLKGLTGDHLIHRLEWRQ